MCEKEKQIDQLKNIIGKKLQINGDNILGLASLEDQARKMKVLISDADKQIKSLEDVIIILEGD